MVDIEPTTQSISDDQELAKVLAGVSQQSDDSMQYEATQTPGAVQSSANAQVPVVQDPVAVVNPPVEDLPPTDQAVDRNSTGGGELAPIKTEAINELRPLVDKLELPPEEKFDTYLLLIRSTDDKTLVAPAHAAAREIADEAKRAQALLDIIKEIDYLSNPPQPNAS